VTNCLLNRAGSTASTRSDFVTVTESVRLIYISIALAINATLWAGDFGVHKSL